MSLDASLNAHGWRPSYTSETRNNPRRGLPKVLLTIMLLLSMTTIVSAQDGATAQLPVGISDKTPKKDDPAPAAPAASADSNSTAPEPPKEEEHHAEEPGKEGEKEDEFLKSGKPRIKIDSISPTHGPVTGDTKVVVRGGPFAQYQQEHPEPKCKFGDSVVGGAYVPCPPKQPKAYEKEGTRMTRTSLCIQCENSPKFATNETTNVTFALSLDGSFEDIRDVTEFWYYKPVKVFAIKPQAGPKDGGTTLQVWGDHFFDFGDDSSCSFGVKSVPAKVMNEGYITCVSPGSDVVGRGMPFSISLNGQ